MTQDANDFLFGGGGKAASFEQMGDMVEGTIVDAKVSQQTSMETNEPLTWNDGSPRMQLVVTLQTKEKTDDNDDGQRRLYAKGGNFEVASGKGKALKDAIADAVKKSGASKIEEGATLKVAFTGEGKKTNRGYAAPKLFTASYEPPTASVDVDDLFD